MLVTNNVYHQPLWKVQTARYHEACGNHHNSRDGYKKDQQSTKPYFQKHFGGVHFLTGELMFPSSDGTLLGRAAPGTDSCTAPEERTRKLYDERYYSTVVCTDITVWSHVFFFVKSCLTNSCSYCLITHNHEPFVHQFSCVNRGPLICKKIMRINI